MFKKLILLAVSAAALVAFAVPAAAQANATVTNSLEEPASTITAFSSNMQWKTTFGTLYCDETSLHIELSGNDAEGATGSGSGTMWHEGGTHCEIVEIKAKVWTVTEVSISHLQIDGGGAGSGTVTVIHDFPGPTKCHFSGTASVAYTPGTSRVRIATSLTGKKLEGSGSCPTSATISGDFDVSDEFGVEAILH